MILLPTGKKLMKVSVNNLLGNIEKIHTTEMGFERISKNLGLKTKDIIGWCRKKIEKANITKKGKNWYVQNDDCVITINSSSYTIITAHTSR